MTIGAHVRAGGDLLGALARGRDIGADYVQIFSHENIGAGTIGAAALGALLSHPALVGLPTILEVPGGRQGARREDVAAARAAVALAIGLRQAS
jgi:endonuclease IV